MNRSTQFMALVALTAVAGQCIGANPVTQTSEGVSRNAPATKQSAEFFPLKDVRLLAGPFSDAVRANRQYLLAHDPDRFLAPFWREAGLEPKARPYGNWESSGLDGHSAGHYLSALSLMTASGADPDGEFSRRLDYMIDELAQIQEANGNGYLGGIPGASTSIRRTTSRAWSPAVKDPKRATPTTCFV